MRFIQQTKQKFLNGINYVYNFSTGQVGAALGSGLPTIYYLQMLLRPIVGSGIAFSVSIPLGGGVAIIMIYAAEKDNKKLIQELKTEFAKEKAQFDKLQVKYLKTKGVYEHIDLEQMKNITIDEQTIAIFLMFKNIFLKLHENKRITKEDLEINLLIRPVKASTRFTGGTRAYPEDKFEKICRHFEDDTPATEDKDAGLGFLKKFGRFVWNSKALPRAVIVSYLAMISYYLDFTLEETGVDSWAAWSISIFLATIASPLIVYFTTAPSRDELAHLQGRITSFHDTNINLEVGISGLEHMTGELKELSAGSTKNLKTLLTTISQKPPEEITLGFLSESLKIFNQDSKSRIPQRTEFKLPSTTPAMFQPATPATPLLRGHSSSSSVEAIELGNINADPTTSTSHQSSRFCAIV